MRGGIEVRFTLFRADVGSSARKTRQKPHRQQCLCHKTTQAGMPVLLNLCFLARRDDFPPAWGKRSVFVVCLATSRKPQKNDGLVLHLSCTCLAPFVFAAKP